MKGLFSLQSGEVSLQGHLRIWGKSLAVESFHSPPHRAPSLPSGCASGKVWVCLAAGPLQAALGASSPTPSQPPRCSSPFPLPPAAQPGVSVGSMPGHTFCRQIPAPGAGPSSSWRLRPELQQPQLGGGTQVPHPCPCHHCPQGCLGRLGAGCCFSWPCPHLSASLVGRAHCETVHQ